MNGGAEHQSYLLASHLKEKYEVSFIYIQTEHREPVIHHNGITLYGIPKHKFLRRFGNTNFLDLFKIYFLLKKIKPDYIYQRVASAYTGIAAYYSKHYCCKSIWHISSEEDVSKVSYKFWKYAILNFVDKFFLYYGIKHANYIIAQTEYQKKKLKDNFNREPDIVVKNFHPVPKEIKMPANPPIILYIANFKKIKQPELFMKLASELRNLDARFLMIGRNAYFKNINTFSKINNLEYLGELPEDKVSEILSVSTILVNTSISEGFSNTFIQAWLRGVPVVSLHSDPDNVIQKYNLGFRSGAFEQLVIDTRKIVEDKKLRSELSINSINYARKYHSLSNIEQLLSVVGL